MRVSGVTIPKDKKVKIALTYVYGIGETSASDILEAAQVDKEKRVKNLDKEDQTAIRQIIEKNYKTEGELRREVNENIKRLKEIDCYRGERHEKDLPVRGQRTRTNSRTVRGNVRNTAVSGNSQSRELK